MAIALRNVTNVDQFSGANTIVINKPTGTVDGDVLYAIIEADAAATISAPSGWTLLDTQSTAGAQKTSVYRKVASGEGASWTWTASFIYEGNVSAWTGMDTATVTDGATGGVGNSTTATAPTLTPTLTNDASVVGYTTWNSAALSLPAGYTNVASFGSAGDVVRIAWLQLASASATGAVNSTVTTASQWTGQHILFKSAASASTVTAPLLRPATMRFRGSLGALLMGRIAARVFPDVVNTGSIGALSGSAIATAVTSGAVTGKGAVIGAAVARATPTGTLTGTGAILGASAARAVVAGTGTTLNPISGATIATAITTGTVTGKAVLVGAANVSAIATGALAGKGALSGASVVTVIASGATAGKGALSGQAVGTAITTGTVSSAAANLSGTAVCTAIVSGAVTGKGALAGQSICRTTVTGTSSVAASPISGAAVCAVVSRGTVSGVGAVVGSTNATATASGALQAKGALTGSAVITCQAIGFVANIPTPNISGAAVCRVDVSGLFVDVPLVPQNQPTGGRGFRSAPKWWKDKPTPQHIVGQGAFTLPGNSMAGRGSFRFDGKGAFDLLPFTHNGQAEQSFGGVGEFELDHMGIRMWSQVENKVYATALASPEMSAVCTVSMDDREEEEIIIKLLYEN